MRHTRGARDDRGSVTIVMLAAIAIAAGLMLGIARVGGAAVLRARADTAADAAALAAADALASGGGAPQAVSAAVATARANGARLVDCDCFGTHAEVVVAVRPSPALHLPHDVLGRARADVDESGAFSARRPPG